MFGVSGTPDPTKLLVGRLVHSWAPVTSQRTLVGTRGQPWAIVGIRGHSWESVSARGHPWTPMGDHGHPLRPWASMGMPTDMSTWGFTDKSVDVHGSAQNQVKYGSRPQSKRGKSLCILYCGNVYEWKQLSGKRGDFYWRELWLDNVTASSRSD